MITFNANDIIEKIEKIFEKLTVQGALMDIPQLDWKSSWFSLTIRFQFSDVVFRDE